LAYIVICSKTSENSFRQGLRALNPRRCRELLHKAARLIDESNQNISKGKEEHA
jgi:hypothetical protein